MIVRRSLLSKQFLVLILCLCSVLSWAQGYRVSEPLRDSVVREVRVGTEVIYTYRTAVPKTAPSTSSMASNWARRPTEEEILADQDAEASRTEAEFASSAGDRVTYDVGFIPFEESVSPTGGRIYSIPITTIPGWKLVPSVSLVYNSQGGNDVAGFGWGLSGIPSIHVRNKNLFYDDTAKVGIYDSANQSYALDGIPIITSDVGIPDYPLGTARGRVQIRKHVGAGNRVLYFTALYPDGSTATFGFTDATGPQTTYPLTSLTDIEGNTLTVSYTIQM